MNSVNAVKGKIQLIHLCVLLAGLMGCQQETQPKFQLLPSSQTGITFNNQINETEDFNSIKFIYIYNGGGVGSGDINNDGLPDLFFAGNQVPSKLYLNKGNFQFEDITQNAGINHKGWATGVSMVDINADGLLDIYVCVAGRDSLPANQLYINQGENKFIESAKAYGLDDTGYSTQAAFFDYDLDGDLDMYLLTNGLEKFSHNNTRPRKLKGEGVSTDRLYRNNGDNTFTNVSMDAGITIEGYGLGIGILDVNNDGWPDVYCANDFISNDLLWVNNGDGTFTEGIRDYITQTSHNGMGMDISDYNNDGVVDIVEVDMLPENNLHNKTMTPAMNYENQRRRFEFGYLPQYVRNTLQVGNRDGKFSESGRLAGVHKTDWSWAPLLADLDNDGFKDLFISNGYGRDITDLDYIVYSKSTSNPFGTKETRELTAYEDLHKLPTIDLPNYFFRNNGDLTFDNVTSQWSAGISSMSNGAVYVDLDLDGDLDIVSNNINREAFIYNNTTRQTKPAQSHFLDVRLKGSAKNPNGIGSKVTLFNRDTLQCIYQYPVRGYLSSIENVVHFGLGNHTAVESLEIIWPDGKIQNMKNPTINTIIELDYRNAQLTPTTVIKNSKSLLEDQTDSFPLVRHKENQYIDFLDQPLLLKMLSREGPGLAVGDVNNDGYDDFVLGSALNDTSYFWMQQPSGHFKKGNVVTDSWLFEDLGSLLLDVNGDDRLDLYVVSGGNEFAQSAKHYQDRLYIQQADGSFVWDSNVLPEMSSSTGTVNAADMDGDGDLDLFVGSRLLPHNYPLPGQSYLLENVDGKFRNVTSTKAPGLESIGLVTAALWTDFNNDDKIDLIVVGEWMEISFFENMGTSFNKVTKQTGMANMRGLWSSINGGDFDQDGDIDYIVGNLGLNTELKASADEPVNIVAKDFDANGSMDPLIGYYVQGVQYPLPSRDALITQIPAMKKRFQFYKDYGKVNFKDVFSKTELHEAFSSEITYLKSIYIENVGNGKFELNPLPMEAQMAPLYGTTITDLNGDTFLDVLTVGNRRDAETLSGFLDGSNGMCMLGDGHGNFSMMKDQSKTGFVVSGEARGIAQLMTKDRSLFLVANNNEPVQFFSTPISKEKNIPLKKDDAYALITQPNGDVYRQEFYFGNGYLTQSSRVLRVPESALKVEIVNSGGIHRLIK